MSIYTDKSVEIEIVDNGWVLTWQDNGADPLAGMVSGYPKKPAKTRGRELFTDRKKLLKRIDALL